MARFYKIFIIVFYYDDYIIEASSVIFERDYWITIDLYNIYKIENNEEIKEKIRCHYYRLRVDPQIRRDDGMVGMRFFYRKEQLMKVIPKNSYYDDYLVYIKGEDY